MANVHQPQQPNNDGRPATRHRSTTAGKLRPLRVKVPRLVEHQCGHWDIPSVKPSARCSPSGGDANDMPELCRRCQEDVDRRRLRRLAELEGSHIGRGRAIRGGDAVED